MRGPGRQSLLKEARAIIDRNALDVPFGDDDRTRLADVTGTELRFVVRRRNPEFPNDTRHLHVLAYDWTTPAQWSWRNAILIDRNRSPEESARMRLHQREQQALRFAIRDDLRDFLDAQWPAECAACGSGDNLTADHAGAPFIEIARSFLETHRPLELRSAAGIGDVIASMDIEAEWIEFHASRAVYEVLCRSCNSRKGARGHS